LDPVFIRLVFLNHYVTVKFPLLLVSIIKFPSGFFSCQTPTAMSVLKIFGQGNPLLDISAPVPVELLTKYDLQPSNAILAEDKHLPLYEELAAMPDVQYIPGGATLNSIRVANWMLQDPGHCSYVGCIGKDRFGDIMLKKCQDEGLTVPFMISETVPTGTCGVLVTGIQRSLVANLGAANAFKEEHYEQSTVAKTAMETADILYSAGFFLTVSVPSVIRAGKYALANNKTLVLNFSAPFISNGPRSWCTRPELFDR